MTHLELTDLLEMLALRAGAASFWHGKQTEADINYDAKFPQAHLFLMPSQLKAGNVTTQVAMAFYGHDNHENGSQDSIKIQNEMDLLTQQFAALLEATPSIDVVDELINRSPVLRKGSGVGTGYFISFTLAHIGINAC
ncbi:hypothetical protein [Hymenobacter sp. GOD-10R]|uniref:hypothetical protein n=1 Tax=Hymenobacter sp. GOD-10R TaxID=3093922 RepID=UPI002D7754BA|nr:hypothetical protein [Hymenobacter sp. GOD-10R]WRQ26684.1 hypothetical protein SD425_16550 [Hymenobacter sp. GOD-10R]